MVVQIIVKYPEEGYYDRVEIYSSSSDGKNVLIPMSPDGILHLTFNQFLDKIYSRYCIIEHKGEFITFLFNELSIQLKA